MLRFEDRPIRQKLLIITVATTAVALILAGLGIVLADSILFRGYLRRDLTALARIVADNSTAALAFNDPDSAAITLGALHARTHVDGACVYRADKTILSQYGRNAGFVCPAPEPGESIRFIGGKLRVSEPIRLNGRAIGTLMLLYDLGEIGERIVLYGTTVFGVLLAASLLALLFSSRLRTAIATPISELVGATTSVSQTGDYSIRAQKMSGDELGVLVDRFNEMLVGIQSRDNSLKQALADKEAALHEAERERERFVFLAESMPQKIFTAEPNGNVDYYNQQWFAFTGLTVEQITTSAWIQFVHPEDAEENIRAWRQSIKSGEPFLFEHRFRRADGKYCWHLSRALAMRDPEDRITMWIGSSTDIDDQKEKEEALRRANADLEQFAYSASHDLQEPIRNVAVYSEIVARRYERVLDADGKMFLSFLREGSARLATLVRDLLAYTRASMAELLETPVDSAAVLRETMASLAEGMRQSGATVTYDKLPEVFIGAAHLEQVFQNLLSNALKYRTEAQPKIHISAEKRGENWYFSVADNGIGIDPQYKEKIFGVFKRLHHNSEFTGTGIGLAICQRVVERYGGRIWVESKLGKGATFVFTIPERATARRKAEIQSSIS